MLIRLELIRILQGHEIARIRSKVEDGHGRQTLGQNGASAIWMHPATSMYAAALTLSGSIVMAMHKYHGSARIWSIYMLCQLRGSQVLIR